VDRLHPSERGHRLLARLAGADLAERGLPPVALPAAEPGNPEPSLWAQAHGMATKGTGWLVRRSRDLVSQLLRLAARRRWLEGTLLLVHLAGCLADSYGDVLRHLHAAGQGDPGPKGPDQQVPGPW
jgi:hypothetical protein